MAKATLKTAAANPKALALLIALAGFMELFDGTVIQTALPAIGRDLGVSAASASVTMAAYFAAAAGAIPICSWLTDRLGAKVAFTGGIVVFALASVLCGSASALTWLVVFRVIQGVGGAVMMTVGQIVILRDAPKDKLLSITAYLVWPALAAPVIAPVVGGLITDSVGWRWLFFINLPLGAVAAIASLRLAPKRTDAHVAKPLDGVGALLLGVGLCTLVPALGMFEAGASSTRLTAIFVGLIALTGSIFWLLHHKNPLLRLDAYRFATYRAANGAGAIFRIVFSSVPVVLTLMFQLSYGWTPVHAGMLVMMIFVGNLSIKPFANYSVRRWGYRTAVLLASSLGALTLLSLTTVASATSLLAVVPLLYLSGAARSIGFTSYTSMQYLDVPKDEMGTASPLSNSIHQVATAVGIAASVGAVTGLQASGMAALTAYHWVFGMLAVALLLSAVWASRLPASFGTAR